MQNLNSTAPLISAERQPIPWLGSTFQTVVPTDNNNNNNNNADF